ncbi:MAG TPA: DNA topoisomerase VI subunit B, partial [Candidatus Hypogeohydataceae bacterium YC40]
MPQQTAAKGSKLEQLEITTTRDIAHEMAQRQREISISEFFTKNRHLLGFDNPKKALLTCVKEGVDNSLDACEEAGILPEIVVKIDPTEHEDRFRVTVEDNGPGILKNQIPRIFAKLLYGSKFHRLKMARGQQGIGISAAGMYGQLTTGRPVCITSRTKPGKPAYYCELMMDTQKNEPVIVKEQELEWERPHGTKVTIELEAK